MTVTAAMDPAADDSKKETAKEEQQELVRFSLPVNVLSVKMLGNGKWEGVNQFVWNNTSNLPQRTGRQLRLLYDGDTHRRRSVWG